MGTLYLDRSVSSYVAILLAALSHWWAVRRFTRGHDISPREYTRKWLWLTTFSKRSNHFFMSPTFSIWSFLSTSATRLNRIRGTRT